jgi:serine/threonine-protein kinase
MLPREGDVLTHTGGNYRLIKEIGRGSFGVVWRAEAPDGRLVAIKVVDGSIAPEKSQRELKALKVMSGLRHPHLLEIHAFWQLEEQLIIAMDLADGSLRDWQKAVAGPLPIEELIGYVHQAAEALDYLHSQHILHRDVNPKNILLWNGKAKVADFGLARLVEETRRLHTISSVLAGTIGYTAPEMFWIGKTGTRSDQYSLAVTYAELRLNRPLFPRRSHSIPDPREQFMPDLAPLSQPEQRVLLKALAWDLEERYGSCVEFVRALERVLR